MNENTMVALLNTLCDINVKGADTKKMAACIECVENLIAEERNKAAAEPAEPVIE